MKQKVTAFTEEDTLSRCMWLYTFAKLQSESRCTIDFIYFKKNINSTTLIKLLIFSNLFVASNF